MSSVERLDPDPDDRPKVHQMFEMGDDERVIYRYLFCGLGKQQGHKVCDVVRRDASTDSV